MKEPNKLILLKDLPNCPKGQIFIEDIAGDFFLSITDEDAINGKIKQYTFTKEEVLMNRDWFWCSNKYFMII